GCDRAAGYVPVSLPKSEVLEYVLEDGGSVIVRPSGTEPKLKIYLSAKGNSREEAAQAAEALEEDTRRWTN
ncbi:MAG: hypothetical protein Q4C22_05450, partial [Bacillota bacterium]|nr:hypothetical protein [Bacillota bacterium]